MRFKAMLLEEKNLVGWWGMSPEVEQISWKSASVNSCFRLCVAFTLVEVGDRRAVFDTVRSGVSRFAPVRSLGRTG